MAETTATETIEVLNLYRLLPERDMAASKIDPGVPGWKDAILGKGDYNRHCAVSRDTAKTLRVSRLGEFTFNVPVADAQRWYEASSELMQSVKSAYQQASVAHRLLPPPSSSRLDRALWEIRFAGRRGRRLARYRAAWERTHGELLEAYRIYDERAGDVVSAMVEAETERRNLEACLQHERNERAAKEREQRRKKAIAALGKPGARVWSCDILTHREPHLPYSDSQVFEIWIPGLEDREHRGTLLSDVTAREVQRALAEARRKQGPLGVIWSPGTMQAMRRRQNGRYGDEATTWRELTGEREEPVRRRRSRWGGGAGGGGAVGCGAGGGGGCGGGGGGA